MFKDNCIICDEEFLSDGGEMECQDCLEMFG